MDRETHEAFQQVREDLGALRIETREGFRAVDARFTVVDQRLEAIDRRFEAVDQRFDTMDARFDTMDRRFDGMEARIDEFRRDILRQFGVIAEGLRDEIRRSRGAS